MHVTSSSAQNYAALAAQSLLTAVGSGNKQSVATTQGADSGSKIFTQAALVENDLFAFNSLARRKGSEKDLTLMWKTIMQVLDIVQSLISMVGPYLKKDPAPADGGQKLGDDTTGAESAAPAASEGAAEATTPSECGCTDKNAPIKKDSVGDNTFLWKPVSDKDSKLAVLLPSELLGKIESVQIVDPKTKKIIETGKNAGKGNGDRAHFRFSKAGGKYPDGAIVRVKLEDGSTKTYKIAETSKRFEKPSAAS